METLTTHEFLPKFKRIWDSPDRHICFVLGAGASVSSGIRSGGDLAREWLEEIKHTNRFKPEVYDRFIQEKDIDPDNPAASYGEIYHECFRHDLEAGYEAINIATKDARPGYGYSVLAQMLSKGHHNIIITTNFNNLTEEALYTLTDSRPLVCGHESLAGFARPSVARPLIVKVHRDRFLAPMSQPGEIDNMDTSWVAALNRIFGNRCVPIFIGYGGNDGSLMGYLEQVDGFDNLFWCVRRNAVLPQRVSDFLEARNGKLVEIDGFDELMFMLQDCLQLPLLHEQFIPIAESRKKDYQETVEAISRMLKQSADVQTQEATQRLAEKAPDNWWGWQLRGNAADTLKTETTCI